jgi:hypothetical protein
MVRLSLAAASLVRIEQHQAAAGDVEAARVYRGQSVPGRQRDDVLVPP